MIKKLKPVLLLLFSAIALTLYAFYPLGKTNDYGPIPAETMTNEAAFNTMMQVVAHPRCVNCHPSDGVPKRGMDAHPHPFGRDSASSKLGFNTLLCASCHTDTNDNYAGQPGAPHWGLAPPSMAWEGLSKTEIARVMLDTSKNGNRTHEELLEHLTEDELVLWAFNP
ncbi:hypothetical protein LCGC14_3045940, partial [marine sediment metagenome]